MSEDNNQNNTEKPRNGLVESLAKQQVESLVAKMENKAKREKKKSKFYYSFLTLVLLFCLVQIGFGVILNISKTISYQSKISTLEKIRNRAEIKNKDLKQDIHRFSSSSSLEGIARNNLKMAGEDEVLILINKPKEEMSEEEMLANKHREKAKKVAKKEKLKNEKLKKEKVQSVPKNVKEKQDDGQ